MQQTPQRAQVTQERQGVHAIAQHIRAKAQGQMPMAGTVPPVIRLRTILRRGRSSRYRALQVQSEPLTQALALDLQRFVQSIKVAILGQQVDQLSNMVT